jgi:hypothetical protein
MSPLLRLSVVSIGALLIVGAAVYWFNAMGRHDQYRIRLIGADPDQVVQKLKEFTSKPDQDQY